MCICGRITYTPHLHTPAPRSVIHGSPCPQECQTQKYLCHLVVGWCLLGVSQVLVGGTWVRLWSVGGRLGLTQFGARPYRLQRRQTFMTWGGAPVGSQAYLLEQERGHQNNEIWATKSSLGPVAGRFTAQVFWARTQGGPGEPGPRGMSSGERGRLVYRL